MRRQNSRLRQALDLSTSKWGHGSPVSWASFLPIFSLLCPSVLGLGSYTLHMKDRQTDRLTDRQTTAINAYAATLWGRGLIRTHQGLSRVDKARINTIEYICGRTFQLWCSVCIYNRTALSLLRGTVPTSPAESDQRSADNVY